jgi:hypothetical protein
MAVREDLGPIDEVGNPNKAAHRQFLEIMLSVGRSSISKTLSRFWESLESAATVT